MNLDNDIRQLKKFGVVLENTYYHDLYKQIELNYVNIPRAEANLDVVNDKISDLIAQIKLYVTGSSDLVTQDFCNVPVNMFNDLAHDCGYYDYEMKSLREFLTQQGYIRTVGDRYAILARIKDRPERVIQFFRDKLEVELSVTKRSQKKSESSDKHEA